MFLLCRCTWFHLSSCTELLHSKQVWRKLLLGLFARRYSSPEDSYEADLWYSGMLIAYKLYYSAICRWHCESNRSCERDISWAEEVLGALCSWETSTAVHCYIKELLFYIVTYLQSFYWPQGTITNDALMTCCCGLFETCRMAREIRIRNGDVSL